MILHICSCAHAYAETQTHACGGAFALPSTQSGPRLTEATNTFKLPARMHMFMYESSDHLCYSPFACGFLKVCKRHLMTCSQHVPQDSFMHMHTAANGYIHIYTYIIFASHDCPPCVAHMILTRLQICLVNRQCQVQPRMASCVW